MADKRNAHVYRLTAMEALEAVLAYAEKRGLPVPKAIEGGRVDVENGVVVVTVVDAAPKLVEMVQGPSMLS